MANFNVSIHNFFVVLGFLYYFYFILYLVNSFRLLPKLELTGRHVGMDGARGTQCGGRSDNNTKFNNVHAACEETEEWSTLAGTLYEPMSVLLEMVLITNSNGKY